MSDLLNFYAKYGVKWSVLRAAWAHSSGNELVFEDKLIGMLGAGNSYALRAIAERNKIDFVNELPYDSQHHAEQIKELLPSFVFDGSYVPVQVTASKLVVACVSRKAINSSTADMVNNYSVREKTIEGVLAPHDFIVNAYHNYFVDSVTELDNHLADLEQKQGDSYSSALLTRAVVSMFACAAFKNASDAMIQLLPDSGFFKLKIGGVAMLITETTPQVMRALVNSIVSTIAGENDSKLNQTPLESVVDFASLRSDTDDSGINEEIARGQSLLSAYRFRLQIAKPRPSTDREQIYIVFRVIRKEATNLSLDELGYGAAAQYLKTITKQSSGLILFAGATGSGKTTSADAMLAEVDPIARWVYTIENPIEYPHPLFVQHEVRGGGDEYLQVIKSLLRANPDLCFFGETREAEIAQRLCELALTGSLVLSTLHASDSASAIQRLRDWGVDNATIAEVLIVVIGQRLLTKLCQKCAVAVEDKEITSFYAGAHTQQAIMQIKTANEAGCEHCAWTGYKGQWLIYEKLPVNDSVKKLIAAGKSPQEIRHAHFTDDQKQRMDIGIFAGVKNGFLDAYAMRQTLAAGEGK